MVNGHPKFWPAAILRYGAPPRLLHRAATSTTIGITEPGVDKQPTVSGRLVRGAVSGKITADDLTTIDAPDLLASRVFGQSAATQSSLSEETESSFD